MTTTANIETAHDPVQALIDNLREQEHKEAQERDESITAIEEALEGLNAWSERLEQWQTESESQAEERLAKLEEAAQECLQYEDELDRAGERINDLEVALQERTEELLRAQAANNALAALQSPGGHRHAHEDEHAATPPRPMEFDPPAEGPEVAKSGQSVSERFERLRHKAPASE